jgi:hypothetical protein
MRLEDTRGSPVTFFESGTGYNRGPNLHAPRAFRTSEFLMCYRLCAAISGTGRACRATGPLSIPQLHKRIIGRQPVILYPISLEFARSFYLFSPRGRWSGS